MPYDSPLPTGNTVGSVEGSVQLNDLMELCTKLTKQVTALEKDLAMTKQHYATELNQMKAEIKRLQDEVESLKKHNSSTSPLQDDDSIALSEDLGNSPKQGRIRTEAEFKGRRLNFEEDFTELDASDDVQEKEDEVVGSKEVFADTVETDQVTVETHQVSVEKDNEVVDVAEDFKEKEWKKAKFTLLWMNYLSYNLRRFQRKNKLR